MKTLLNTQHLITKQCEHKYRYIYLYNPEDTYIALHKLYKVLNILHCTAKVLWNSMPIDGKYEETSCTKPYFILNRSCTGW